jgi:type II secretory pathway pseudopilin PulG
MTHPTSASRQRGFTLIELLTIVVVMGVLGVLALYSVGSSQSTTDVAAFASNVRNSILTARRRAVATSHVYLLDLRAAQVQWCQIPGTPQGNTLASPAAACPVVGYEAGPLIPAGRSATAVGWLPQTLDVGQTTPNSQSPMPAQLYFLPNGTIQSNPTSANLNGFTAFFQGTDAAGNGDATQKQKLTVYVFDGRPRIYDTW